MACATSKVWRPEASFGEWILFYTVGPREGEIKIRLSDSASFPLRATWLALTYILEVQFCPVILSYIFKTESDCVAQVVLDLRILLLQSPESWGDRRACLDPL